MNWDLFWANDFAAIGDGHSTVATIEDVVGGGTLSGE
jgi:hypothetical protein